MPDFTRKAIKASFIKLLEEKPLAKITVREIVEDCGINRNSFYYHYRDIPALLEEIIKDNVDGVVEQFPDVQTLEDCAQVVLRFLTENRKAIFHIYNSVNRSAFESSLMETCGYAVTTYIETAFPESKDRLPEKETVVLFIRCELFGLCVDWLEAGMKEDAQGQILKILDMTRGLSEDWLRRRGQ